MRSKERQEILRNMTPDAQYAITMDILRDKGFNLTSKDAAYQSYCQFCQGKGFIPDARSDFEDKLSQSSGIKQEMTIGTKEYWVGLKLKEK